MILDTLANADRYADMHPDFARGFAYLAEFSAEIPDGRDDIDGDRVFALVQTVQTAPASEKRFEAHRRYIDIQYVLSGKEVMEHSPVGDLTPSGAFDEGKDVGFFHDPAGATRLLVTEGTFAIFFPHDGHKPCCAAAESATVRKIVIKVAVQEIANPD
ncbi:MAG TPA: YhcH/YjgK/YiaL family protein [Opitutaceae bacterium]